MTSVYTLLFKKLVTQVPFGIKQLNYMKSDLLTNANVITQVKEKKCTSKEEMAGSLAAEISFFLNMLWYILIDLLVTILMHNIGHYAF